MQTQLERLLEKLTRIERMHATTKAAILAITEPRTAPPDKLSVNMSPGQVREWLARQTVKGRDPFSGVPLTARNRAYGWRDESPCAQNWEQTTNGYSCAELAEMGDV